MLVIVLPVFIIGAIQTIRSAPALEADTSWEGESKIIGEGNNSGFLFWNESAILIGIHDRDPLCKGNANSIFPDTSSCNRYYRCRNEAAEFYKCISGFMFDVNEKKCRAEGVAMCYDGSKAADQCYLQADGFYPDHRTDCREYYRCENGKTAESMSCPPGHSFSYQLQSCQLESEVTCVDANCKVGYDDFFIHPGTRCQAYYYCRRGVRSDFLCPDNFIFDKDQKKCVEGGLCYEPICTGRIDGDYPDTTHDCRRSFTCKGGHLREINTCSKGQKYSGRACISESFTHCDKPGKTAISLHIRNDICKGQSDGYHILPGSNCRNYRTCLKGRTISTLECPKGERFNGRHCSSNARTPCDDFCSLKKDGYHADESTNCEEYYSCSWGEIIERKKCPNGMIFNGQKCVLKNLATCAKKAQNREVSDFCVGLSDGFHPDYLDGCKNYYYCLNHERVLTSSCADDTVWNGKKCVDKKFFTCEGPKTHPECSGLIPGLYQDKKSNCANYFYCKNGNGTKLSCPVGEIYDGENCVRSDEYTCNNPDECQNQPDGYKFDVNAGCRSYFFCSNGRKITYVCSDNFLFNGTQCVPPGNFKCPFSSQDCLHKPNGYHPDKSSDCRKYFYCFNGEKITTITCGGKKIFDGRKCVLTNDPTICADSDNFCKSKSDGYHPDAKSFCKKYFFCENGKVKNENFCPDGSGWDGKKCAENFKCGEEKISNCPRPGFYPDLSSKCRKYYFCVGDKKTVLSCPPGKIFNRQICVDESSYQCPNEGSSR